MPLTMDFTETLVVTHCWCGIALAIPSNLERIGRDEGKAIYCPIGHSFVFGNSYKEQLAKERAKLQRKEERLQATRELLVAEERSHAATRGVVTKQKKKLIRVTNGVCPCCNRTFQNLMRHMTTKHPDYVPKVEAKAT